MPSKSYLRQLNRDIKAKLRQEKKDDLAKIKAEKKEQAASLKLMKKRGIEERHKKAYAATRERRLKKLGMKVEKEKKGGNWIFHVDKSGYKRRKTGGLFSSKKPAVTIKWGIKKKKKGRSKKHTGWSKFFSHMNKL